VRGGTTASDALKCRLLHHFVEIQTTHKAGLITALEQ
jgi:hypothetical protein